MRSRIEELPIEDQAALTNGATFWRTHGVAAAGIPALLLADGPHGIRRQPDEYNFGIGESLPATCFPPAVALGATFDAQLVRQVGAAIGREARALGVDVLLGPGLNLKRSPLGGRNFEYYSEDPWLSGQLAAGMVDGIQSEGVAATAKHFAANNQETDRLRVSSEVDERTLRELYLRAFEHVVRAARPWAVMCSYNSINGVPAAENGWLLTEVLRQEWGYDGVVVSDWGAVADRVASLKAGLDLQMPAAGRQPTDAIVGAIASGDLDPGVLAAAARRMATLAERTRAATAERVDPARQQAIAREAAARAVVLLKNDGLLPLQPSSSIAVIGALAAQPRIQGGGSSRVNPTSTDNLLAALRERYVETPIEYAPGYSLDATDPRTLARLQEEATVVAGTCATTVLVVGLPDAAEAEGADRTSLALPDDQLDLIAAVLDVAPRTVIVLVAGGVVDVAPFDEQAGAIVHGWLLGQAGGSALCDILVGDVVPSGRLAETIPLSLKDVPSYLHFPGDSGAVRYGEGLFVGYRGHDALGHHVRYPFGHGLSYTQFDYSDLEVLPTRNGVRVEFLLQNTGQRRGREIAQLYVGVQGSSVARPPRELKGVCLRDLEPGTRRSATIEVCWDELRYWDTTVRQWRLEGGHYEFSVGASSRDLRLTAVVHVVGDEKPSGLSPQSTLGEILANPAARDRLVEVVRARMPAETAEHVIGESGWAEMMAAFPFSRIAAWPGLDLDPGEVRAIILGDGPPGR